MQCCNYNPHSQVNCSACKKRAKHCTVLCLIALCGSAQRFAGHRRNCDEPEHCDTSDSNHKCDESEGDQENPNECRCEKCAYSNRPRKNGQLAEHSASKRLA